MKKTLTNGAHEAFGELRKHNIRMNPDKCTFDIHSRKFLGFMISKRGIEVNQDKCKVKRETESPKSVKEVQKLAGRIEALSRFFLLTLASAQLLSSSVLEGLQL